MMMKLGTAWFGFRQQTMNNYFEMAAALGLKYVEMPLYWQVIEDGFARYSLTGIASICGIAEQAGIQMVSSVSALDLAGGVDMRGDPIDESLVRFARATAYRAIDIGVALGVSVLRITEPNINGQSPTEAQAYMEAYGEVLHELGNYAADHGVRLVAENYGLTSEQVNWLLDAADHPAVGTLYDPCNYLRIGEDPLSALKNLGDRVYYCHLKDTLADESRNPNQLFPGSRWAPSVAVGEGDIDWSPILKELATVYDGYLCIEYEIADDIMRGTRVSIEHVLQAAQSVQVEIEYNQ